MLINIAVEVAVAIIIIIIIVVVVIIFTFTTLPFKAKESNKIKDKQTDRQTDRQTDGQTVLLSYIIIAFITHYPHTDFTTFLVLVPYKQALVIHQKKRKKTIKITIISVTYTYKTSI